MRMLLNALLAGAVVAAAACGPRQVEVRTAPSSASQVSVQVNNTLTQSVNVYVSQNGTDTFLRQVGASSSVVIPVQGYATGTTANLRAVTVDGVHTYTRNNVTLSGTVTFPVP
jgi:hypothetical protein